MSSLRWTHRSSRRLGRALKVSHTTTWRMLRAQKFGLRSNRKRLSSKTSPHRDLQFRNIERLVKRYTSRGWPAQSVDAKKRELIGNFKNKGRTWGKDAKEVNTYDFPSDAEGVAIPFGLHDMGSKDGFVVVGTTHNTPAFAAHCILTWWLTVGRKMYAKARDLLILADSGSSNSIRTKLWKQALQGVANHTGLRIRVAHYPTGASKWNPVEHRLFSAISNNWAGEPLIDYRTIRNYISHTRSLSGRRVRARLDHNYWPTQKELKASKQQPPPPLPLKIRHSRTLPDLNYVISPDVSRRK